MKNNAGCSILPIYVGMKKTHDKDPKLKHINKNMFFRGSHEQKSGEATCEK